MPAPASRTSFEVPPAARAGFEADPVVACGPIQSDRHVIVLHGWGNEPADMQRWVNALISGGVTAGRYWWNLGYDYRSPFPVGAAAVLGYLKQQAAQGHRFDDVLFLTYSMGGPVARQLIADGFPVTRLATVCGPHEGMMYGPAAPWQAVDPGVASLKQQSSELVTLNANPTEAAARGRYLLTAVTTDFSNAFGSWHHDDDTCVDGFSARGDHLGAEIARHNTNLSYSDGAGISPGAPHKEGMNPQYFGHVLEFLHG